MSFVSRVLRPGLALTSGLAVFNYIQRKQSGPLTNELPGTPHYWHSPYGQISYKTLGEGDPVVLVHGFNAGASSFEVRHQVAPLAKRFKVFAFDWLGFGLSDRPKLVYNPELYTDLLARFLREVVVAPAHAIASSLAGAYVIHVAAQSPDLFRRLVLVAPTGLEGLDEEPGIGRAALRKLFVSPLIGESLYNLLVTPPSLRYFLKQQAYFDPTHITDDIIDAYFTTTHQPGARYAPASFISGFLNLSVEQTWPRLTHPTLLVWGREALSTPVEQAQAFLRLRPDVHLEVFDSARLLPNDEYAPGFNQLALNFLMEDSPHAHPSGDL